MKTRKYMKNSRPGPKAGTDTPAVNTEKTGLMEDSVTAAEPEPVTAAEGEVMTETAEVSERERKPYWIHDQILDPD